MPLTLGEVNKKIEELEEQIHELHDTVESITKTATGPNMIRDEHNGSVIVLVNIDTSVFQELKEIFKIKRITMSDKGNCTYVIDMGMDIGRIREVLYTIDDVYLMNRPHYNDYGNKVIEIVLPEYFSDERKYHSINMRSRNVNYETVHEFISSKIQWITLTAMKHLNIGGGNLTMMKLDTLFNVLNMCTPKCGYFEYCGSFPYNCPKCDKR